MSETEQRGRLLPLEPEPLEEPSAEHRKRPIWEIVLEMAQSHPDEELERIPHDAAEHHDQYLYGSPR